MAEKDLSSSQYEVKTKGDVLAFLGRRLPNIFGKDLSGRDALPNTIRNIVTSASVLKLSPTAEISEASLRVENLTMVQFKKTSEGLHGIINIVEIFPNAPPSVMFYTEDPDGNKLFLNWTTFPRGHHNSTSPIVLDHLHMQLFRDFGQPDKTELDYYGGSVQLIGPAVSVPLDFKLASRPTKYIFTKPDYKRDPGTPCIFDFKRDGRGLCWINYAHEGGRTNRIFVPDTILLAR